MTITRSDIQRPSEISSIPIWPRTIPIIPKTEINHFGYGTQSNTSRKISKQMENAVSIISLGYPERTELTSPLFDYEKMLYDALFTHEYYNPLQLRFKEKHLWVKKATGLGVTEFMLRLMAWLCLRNDD